MTTAAGFAASKSAELQQALKQATDDNEFLDGDFPLIPVTHPVTKEFGFSLSRQAPGVSDANLLVIQHEDTGVVQFVFPVQAGQPMPAGTADKVFMLGFIRPRQLGTKVVDPAKWIVRGALKIAQRGATAVIADVARVIEEKHKTEGFIALANGYDQAATQAQLQQAQGKRVLVFVHGIFSSIKGAFSGLGPANPAGDSQDVRTMKALLEKYSGNVFGYDHWTISKTPLQNATDLLDAIPENANWTVDAVCHSRGGLITRALFANPADQAQLNMPDLHQIVAKRHGKINEVNSAVFVAAANQGSPLADPDDLRNFLNVAAFLASKSPCFALNLVIGLARALVSAAFDLPSVQQLATGSSLIKDLNSVASIMSDDHVYGARADFDHTKSAALAAGVLLDKLLMRVDNDLVVPYAGVASPHPNIPSIAGRLLSFGTPDAKQGKVMHTNFFEQPETQNFLTALLA